MMSKYEEIVGLRDEARVHRKPQELKTYSLIIGEIQRFHHPDYKEGKKVYSDSDVYQTIKSLINTWEGFPAASNQEEIAITKALLPPQLTFDEICSIVNDKKFTNIGQFMGHLKVNYEGQYDGRVAKKVWDSQV